MQPRPRLSITTASLFVWSVTLLLTAVSSVGPAEGSDPDPTAYQREIDDWHKTRIERLKNPNGYLSLVGLFPLEEGENRFGSAEDNDLVFPVKAPAYAGVFTLNGGAVFVNPNESVTITAEDRPVLSMLLKTDAENDPTILAMGSFRFHVINRANRLYVRLRDLKSPLLTHFEGIDRFPVDSAWRIEGRFEPYVPPKKLMVPNVLGYEFEETCPGVVVFEAGGKTCSLEPMSASGGRLLFVFGDETSGLETYGGGRFLVAEPPSQDGMVVLDFNKAYNPPCAFTAFATCPLPHEANRLTVGIEAGEKNYGESH